MDCYSQLTLEEKIEILENYSKLSKDGFIDECLLRTKSEEITKEKGQTITPLLQMNLLATRVAFELANEFVKLKQQNS